MPNEKNMKDPERTQSISLPNVHSNPFGSNISAEKAYRRAERIAAALYILTKYMSDSEPLRTSARSAGHLLLKDILQLRSGFRVDSDAADTSRLHAHVRETISLVQLLAIAGYISKENADMVTRALEELSQFIEASGTTQLAERTTFTREDLLIDQTIRSSAPRAQKGSVSSTASSMQGKQEKSFKGQGNVKDGNSSRRTAILDVLKDGKKMGIRDIASFVVGCSEKTVQRELASLISDGLLKKEGEKRWSRYFVA